MPFRRGYLLTLGASAQRSLEAGLPLLAVPLWTMSLSFVIENLKKFLLRLNAASSVLMTEKDYLCQFVVAFVALFVNLPGVLAAVVNKPHAVLCLVQLHEVTPSRSSGGAQSSNL